MRWSRRACSQREFLEALVSEHREEKPEGEALEQSATENGDVANRGLRARLWKRWYRSAPYQRLLDWQDILSEQRYKRAHWGFGILAAAVSGGLIAWGFGIGVSTAFGVFSGAAAGLTLALTVGRSQPFIQPLHWGREYMLIIKPRAGRPFRIGYAQAELADGVVDLCGEEAACRVVDEDGEMPLRRRRLVEGETVVLIPKKQLLEKVTWDEYSGKEGVRFVVANSAGKSAEAVLGLRREQ